MRILHAVALASGLAVAAGAFPVMAQQDQQQAPMMGQGDQGGMMGQGAQGGGMMGQDSAGQDKSGCPMMGDVGFRRGMKQGMGHGAMMHSVPMMEGRLAYIKADLEITDAQLAAWNAYADAVRARHGTMESMHAEMMKTKESGNALERMDARIKAMESKVEGLKALKPTVEALYAALSDEQKKKADQLLVGGCGM
jgi:hypothetical protein